MSFAVPDPIAQASVLEFQGEMSAVKRNRLAVRDTTRAAFARTERLTRYWHIILDSRCIIVKWR